MLSTCNEDFITFAKDAKNPFQFIAQILSINGVTDDECIPVTQDASSSAYKIMSYLLLDVDLAKRTNLIPSEGHDLYSTINLR